MIPRDDCDCYACDENQNKDTNEIFDEKEIDCDYCEKIPEHDDCQDR
jgi:hypothetical protein